MTNSGQGFLKIFMSEDLVQILLLKWLFLRDRSVAVIMLTVSSSPLITDRFCALWYLHICQIYYIPCNPRTWNYKLYSLFNFVKMEYFFSFPGGYQERYLYMSDLCIRPVICKYIKRLHDPLGSFRWWWIFLFPLVSLHIINC